MEELALAETKGETKKEAQAAPESAAGLGQDRWSRVAGLPTPIMVAVPVPGFRVRDLLALRPGSLVASAWRGDREAPLVAAGHVRFAWAEFEVTDGVLGARITRLSGE